MKSVKQKSPLAGFLSPWLSAEVTLASLPCYVNDGTNVYYGNYRQFLRFFESSPWASRALAVSNKTAATSKAARLSEPWNENEPRTARSLTKKLVLAFLLVTISPAGHDSSGCCITHSWRMPRSRSAHGLRIAWFTPAKRGRVHVFTMVIFTWCFHLKYKIALFSTRPLRATKPKPGRTQWRLTTGCLTAWSIALAVDKSQSACKTTESRNPPRLSEVPARLLTWGFPLFDPKISQNHQIMIQWKRLIFVPLKS